MKCFSYFLLLAQKKVCKEKGVPLTPLSCGVVAAAVIHDGLNFRIHHTE